MSKPEDLTTAEEEDESTEVEVETTTRSEYVACAYNAIAAVLEIDTELMTQEDTKRKKRIIKKSIRIIDSIITELHDELFEDEE